MSATNDGNDLTLHYSDSESAVEDSSSEDLPNIVSQLKKKGKRKRRAKQPDEGQASKRCKVTKQLNTWRNAMSRKSKARWIPRKMQNIDDMVVNNESYKKKLIFIKTQISVQGWLYKGNINDLKTLCEARGEQSFFSNSS